MNNDPVGEVNIEYILLYNQMKCTLDLLAPKNSSIIEDLMTRFSRWEVIENVLVRIFYFGNKKLNFQEAQKKAERTIFLQHQSVAQNYLKIFKGSPYYRVFRIIRTF